MYEGDRVSPFVMGVGMWLYDALALFEMPELHKFLNKKRSLERVPYLRGDKLRGSFVYSDAYMDDDRLVLETLRSANDLGAVVVNYTTAQNGIFTATRRMTAIHCRDEKTQKEFQIKARHFIGTVGPWTDEFGATLFKDWKKILRPSKGIHVILEQKRLPVRDAVVMSTRSDKRIVFVIPRHEIVIVGTTDTDFPEDPSTVHSELSDVNYLLGILNEYFPNANVTKKDLIASYSGVRPLVSDNSATESATSREHLIFTDPRGVTFVAGGKYTTYRRMAEQTIDEALKYFSLDERTIYSKNHTKSPLNPLASEENLRRSRLMIDPWSKTFKLAPGAVSRLIERHGLEAEALLKRTEKTKINSLWEIEAEHAIENTMCLNILDFYLRRTPLFLSYQDHGFQFLDAISQIFKSYFGWSDSELKNQVAALQNHIHFELGWK
jgi:glycerol-3-phosphate dehydrogenase